MQKILLTLLIFSAPIYASEYSVSELLNYANSNSLVIKKMRLHTVTIDKQIAASSLYPDMMFNYSLQNISPDNSQPIKHAFMLQQTIPMWGKNQLQYNVIRSDKAIHILQIMDKQASLRYTVQNDIANSYVARKVRSSIEEELKLMNRLLEIGKSKYATGKLQMAQVIGIEIRISKTIITLMNASNNVELIENNIKDTLDIKDNNFSLLAPDLSLDNIDIKDVSTTVVYNAARKYYYKLKINSEAVKQTDSREKLARRSLYPDFGVAAGVATVPSTSATMFSLEMTMNLPVFSSGKKISKSQMYANKKEELHIEKKEIEDALEKSINREILILKSNLEQAKVLRERIIKLGENNVNTLFYAYQVEKVDFTTLLDSILLLYTLRKQYHYYVGTIYQQLFKLEYLSGMKYYSLK